MPMNAIMPKMANIQQARESLVPDYLTKVPEKIGDKKMRKGDWTTNEFSYTLDNDNKYTLE